MKPGEGMHSAVEEVDIDPCDLYLDLGALIVEGRIPGLNDRGFGEGPHCPQAGAYPQPPQNRHHCDLQTQECQKYEQIQKHMLLLWKNCIPMSIEVLLYPNCCFGSTPTQNVETSSAVDMSYILLEQWTVHMLPRRLPDASINPRGLMQAIRSFLYFSQLCAWYSLSGGKSPQNIHYRVCVPGENFSSKFSTQPESHVFPVANIGRNAAMKVQVKSHPRCGEIPIVLCHKHALPTFAVQQKVVKQESSKSDAFEDKPEEENLLGAEGNNVLDGVLPLDLKQASRTSSPADSMLGESLLDPPNSLCMYPKRYQSPSRCGSPSLEVPEHLMFGKAAAAKREAQRQRLNADMQSRSRPIHRPVIERVLKKTLSNSICSRTNLSSDMAFKRCDLLKAMEASKLPTENVIEAYSCLTDDLNNLPREEVESILHKLRNQCPSARSCTGKIQCPYMYSYPDRFKLLNKQLALERDAIEMNKTLPSSFLMQKGESHLPQSSYSSSPSTKNLYFMQKHLHDLNASDGRKSKRPNESYCMRESQHSRNLERSSLHSSRKFRPPYQRGREESNHEDNYDEQKLYRVRSAYHSTVTDADCFTRWPDQKTDQVPLRNALNDDVTKCWTYRSSCTDPAPHLVPDSLSGVNIKKCGALLDNLNLSDDEVIDERSVENTSNSSPMLQKLMKTTPPSQELIEEFDFSNHGIPSAEEKAKFRRSLDSATSLVFHQKSGLPLTSSPAPTRKSGTCFDFDSSLTTVSAIKKALFEKEPDEEMSLQKDVNFSISIPSSMTNSSLLGTFEESVLNGRLEPVSTVEGFTAEIGASGSFCPRHITLPVSIFFYTLQDIDKVTSPYLGHINLGKREYHIPKKGTVQVTLFNPHRTVVKMFVVLYDLRDMPPNCQTFLRQRTLYMPTDASESDKEAQKWLRYLIHLRFASSKSGRIYLHTDIRVIIFHKSDLDAATVHGQRPYELRSFIQGPVNPKFSPHKPL